MSDNQFSKIYRYIQEQFKNIDNRFDSVDNRFDLLTSVIHGYAGKIDVYAQEMAAMEHKINRLEKYVQVLDDKAGVDLDAIRA